MFLGRRTPEPQGREQLGEHKAPLVTSPQRWDPSLGDRHQVGAYFKTFCKDAIPALTEESWRELAEPGLTALQRPLPASSCTGADPASASPRSAGRRKNNPVITAGPPRRSPDSGPAGA